MQHDFFFWLSVVTTVISVILTFVAIWQYFEGRTAKEKQKGQVKVWMQQAGGISEGLNKVVVYNTQNKFSTSTDVANAVWSVQSSAFALYQSLYEERCIDEKEYKEKQKRTLERLESAQQNGPTITVPTSQAG